MKNHAIVKHIAFCPFLFFMEWAKVKELANPTQSKLFFKISSLQKILKPNRTTHDRTATQQFDSGTDKLIQTLQLDTVDRTAGHNTGLLQWRVTNKFAGLCFLFTFVRGDSDERLIRH